ncbi:hypothetical protein EPN15_00785 [Patescibacteria group bacterium]|nr:MAG: hypothetical protein EPN15_00785 [Patescibacteria group bacterium]
MPYDPRPISQGGNRGIDEKFSRKAPTGKFRVVGVDTFDGDDWVEGDFDAFDEAKKRADEETKDKQMLIMHVYNDVGTHCYEAGEF